jgi:hypothetical protein
VPTVKRRVTSGSDAPLVVDCPGVMTRPYWSVAATVGTGVSSTVGSAVGSAVSGAAVGSSVKAAATAVIETTAVATAVVALAESELCSSASSVA